MACLLIHFLNLRGVKVSRGCVSDGINHWRKTKRRSYDNFLRFCFESYDVGAIGQRSVYDLSAIGDNLGGSTSNSGGTHDQMHHLQMLQAAYCRFPQPKYSEHL